MTHPNGNGNGGRILAMRTPEERQYDRWLNQNATVREAHQIASEIAKDHTLKIVGPMAQMLKEYAIKVAYLEDRLGVTQAELDAWVAQRVAQVTVEAQPEAGDAQTTEPAKLESREDLHSPGGSPSLVSDPAGVKEGPAPAPVIPLPVEPLDTAEGGDTE